MTDVIPILAYRIACNSQLRKYQHLSPHRTPFAFQSAIPLLSRHLLLTGFSTLYTLNVAISNLFLSLSTLPTHQPFELPVRLSQSPSLIYVLYFNRIPHSRQTYSSLIPIISSVTLAAYNGGNSSPMSALGIFLTPADSFLSAFKTIATRRL
jgi:hypothetical protein